MEGNYIHFIAGAVGGTAGAVVTCPLEVLKTRLQSSKQDLLTDRSSHHRHANNPTSHHRHANNHPTLLHPANHQHPHIQSYKHLQLHLQETKGFPNGLSKILRRMFLVSGRDTGILLAESQNYTSAILVSPRLGMISCFRNIIASEGVRALFKGLLPNLVGVAPSRAVYFSMYAKAKSFLNDSQTFNNDTPLVHLLSAAFAGFSASTCTSPLWVIKTRMQLNDNQMSTFSCAKEIYQKDGFQAFYRGITASYYGLAETAIHLVLYEEVKRSFASARHDNPSDSNPLRMFLEYMCAGAISKSIATCIAYPHEVARTRMREESARSVKFWPTLGFVFREEGVRGLYRGLVVQLLRQIPNTAVMMATYEAVLYFFAT